MTTLSQRAGESWSGEKAAGPMVRRRDRKERAGRREYRFYSALLLPFALVAVSVSRMARLGRRSANPHRKADFISEVMEFNRTTVPWIFMGR